MDFHESNTKINSFGTNGKEDATNDVEKLNNQIESINDSKIRNQCKHSLKIKEGANRIFSLSSNLFQKLDAAKAVLVSNKSIENVTSRYINFHLNKEINVKSISKGQITISSIKVPLVWRSLNNKLLADGVYALFCLIQAGNEVRETQLLCDIDQSLNDVQFNDIIQINDINYDSTCKIELYGFTISESRINSRKLARKISNVHTCRMRYGTEKYKDDFLFHIIGSVELSVKDTSLQEISYDLNHLKFKTECNIPLFGTLSCKFKMIPMSKIKSMLASQGEIQFASNEITQSPTFDNFYCELKDRAIHIWKYIDNLKETKPNSVYNIKKADLIIPITKKTKLQYMPSDEIRNSIKICANFGNNQTDYREVLFKTQYLESWYDAILKHLNEQELWKDIFDLEDEKSAPTSFLRHGSVYRVSKI